MQHADKDKSKLIIEAIALTITEERIRLGKSQRMLADEFDIQKSMISRLENGKNEAKIVSIFTICEALGIKTSEFIMRVEEKLPKGFSLIDL